MSRRSDCFNRHMLSTDNAYFRDRGDYGRGVRRIEDMMDFDEESERLSYLTDDAMFLMHMLLFNSDWQHQRLIDVALAIYRNRTDHPRSIVELAKRWDCSYSAARRRYYDHRRKLLHLFGFTE